MIRDTIYLYNDNIGRVQYVQHMGTDKTVVRAARVSFGQDDDKELNDKDRKLIKYLVDNKHTSTLEHCSITFKFVVPLYVRSQHHRHRTWAYNEISRRYTEENLLFYEPNKFRTQHKSNRQASNSEELIDPVILEEDYKDTCASELVASHHRKSIGLYETLMEAGVCREQARGVLPQNMYTEYYGTTNLLNLLKFVDLRMHSGAQWEIQKVAEACLELAEELFPETIKYYRESKKAIERK